MLAVFLFSPGGDIVSDFMLGFTAVTRVISVVCGGAAAVFVFALSVLVCYLALCAIFDIVTALIASRWKRRGHEPRGRLGKIILDSSGRRDGKV